MFFLGASTTGTTLPTTLCGVTLTNATTVTANVNSTGTCTVSYVVVTFKAAIIKSMQKVANTSTTNTNLDQPSVTSFNGGNALLAWGGYTTASTTGPTAIISGQMGTGSAVTSISYSFNTATTNTRTEYSTIIEFVPGVLKSVQNCQVATQSGTTSNTATITAVNTPTSICVFTGSEGTVASSSPNGIYPTATLTNSTTVTMAVNTGVTQQIINATIVEFIIRPFQVWLNDY